MSKGHRRRQNVGHIIGFVVSFACVFAFAMPGQERFYSRGPMNTGHEQLTCLSCHKPTQGTIRQQLQANSRYVLGFRGTPVNFGHQKVTNGICLKCHDRPNDRHRVFRFFEPRFAEARKKIQPQFCTSCHLEHTGKRVTLLQTNYCVHCHKETKLKNDRISIAHEDLIVADNWGSCLGCHDFHGNHVMETNVVVEKALTPKQILEYFEGSASPYSDTKYYKAKQEATRG